MARRKRYQPLAESQCKRLRASLMKNELICSRGWPAKKYARACRAADKSRVAFDRLCFRLA